MAQFHVYRIAEGRLLLDLQSDLIETGARVVAPLFAMGEGPRALGRLEPILEIDGIDHVLHTAEMAAVPAALLRTPPVANFSARGDEIMGAIEMVFSGY